MTARNRYGFQVRPGMRQGSVARALPTRLVSNGNSRRSRKRPRSVRSKSGFSPRPSAWRRGWAEPPRVPEQERRHGGVAPRDERGVRPVFDVLPVEAADAAASRSGAARRSSSSTCSCITSAPATTRERGGSRRGRGLQGGASRLRRNSRRLNPKLESIAGPWPTSPGRTSSRKSSSTARRRSGSSRRRPGLSPGGGCRRRR